MTLECIYLFFVSFVDEKNILQYSIIVFLRLICGLIYIVKLPVSFAIFLFSLFFFSELSPHVLRHSERQT